MGRAAVAALLSVSPANQTYLAGFRALLYTRPILLVLRPDAAELVVPGLEEAHAMDEAAVDRIHVYYEHPEAGDAATPLECLDRALGSLPRGAAIGLEASSCPVGVARHLTDAGYALTDLDPALTRMRAVKDEAEVAMIAEAARIAAAGVEASLARCGPDATELDVDSAGTAAVMRSVSRFGVDVTVDLLTMTPSGSVRSALPHALSTSRRLRDGDVLIHTRQVGLSGYRAELERTAFIGTPGEEMMRVFEAVRAAQRAAIATVGPGIRCSDVDRAARRILGDAGLASYAIHRTGHGIGLSAHEPPYLRYDNDAPLESGMVITVEPGVYIRGIGGFRHSDTVLVGPDGPRVITSYPTDAESLTLGVVSTARRRARRPGGAGP
jgi:Xaa-Pro dipeptidase